MYQFVQISEPDESWDTGTAIVDNKPVAIADALIMQSLLAYENLSTLTVIPVKIAAHCEHDVVPKEAVPQRQNLVDKFVNAGFHIQWL